MAFFNSDGIAFDTSLGRRKVRRAKLASPRSVQQPDSALGTSSYSVSDRFINRCSMQNYAGRIRMANAIGRCAI
jgi:hypothetical protein